MPLPTPQLNECPSYKLGNVDKCLLLSDAPTPQMSAPSLKRNVYLFENIDKLNSTHKKSSLIFTLT